MKRTSILLVFLLLIPLNELFAQFDRECINYYYGFDVEQDYQKAKECFEKDESNISYIFLILMYLNGDGVEINYDKALKTLKQWEKDYPNNNATMENLSDIILTRSENHQNDYDRLEYWHIASTTYDIGFSSKFQVQYEDQQFSKYSKTFDEQLNEAQIEKFIQLKNAFDDLISQEKHLVELMETANKDNLDQQFSLVNEVTNKYRDRLKNIFSKHPVPKYFENDLLLANEQLNSTLSTFYKFISFWITEKDDAKHVQDLLTQNQQFWNIYTDSWLVFFKTIDNSMFIDQYLVSLKTELTLERIEELEEMHSRFSF